MYGSPVLLCTSDQEMPVELDLLRTAGRKWPFNSPIAFFVPVAAVVVTKGYASRALTGALSVLHDCCSALTIDTHDTSFPVLHISIPTCVDHRTDLARTRCKSARPLRTIPKHAVSIPFTLIFLDSPTSDSTSYIPDTISGRGLPHVMNLHREHHGLHLTQASNARRAG